MGGGMSIEMWRADRDDAGVRSELQSKVFDELRREIALDSADLHVDVHDRVVILSGAVRSYPDKLGAGRAARRVRGVRDVQNDIAVVLPPPQRRSDVDLVEAASCVIESDVLVPLDKIDVAIASGWATLTGTVDRYADRLAAEDAIQRLVGVTGVTNQIIVRLTTAPSDARARVKEALERRPALRGDRIKVDVRGGYARLRGRVRSLAERDEAVAAAASTPGVAQVLESLSVGR